MADPVSIGMAAVSMGSTVIGGITKAAGAQVNAQAAQLGIQGQMLQTMGQAFGFQTQAQQYTYQSNISKYQAAVADINKSIANQDAEYSRDVGEVEAQQLGMKHASELHSMIATEGASGVDVSSGSSARVRESMIDLSYYDQATTRASAAKKAYGFEVEATQDENQANVYRYTAQMQEDQAKNAMTASSMTMASLPLQQQAMGLAQKSGDIGVMGSLVGAAGSVASKWVDISQKFG